MDKHFFGLTDTGKSRENNEDSFIVESLHDDHFILAAVIDGVGGYQGGEVAAEIARQQISGQFQDIPADPIAQMIKAFKLTNEVIAAKKQTENQLSEMACVATLVLADIENNQFYYAHVGDTRLYLLRDGSLIKITKDHSFVGFLEDSGRLDESAAMQHPKRNEINKAIGFSDQIQTDESYIETGQSPFLPGDLLLLCSDGLTDMVNRQDMLSMIAQGDTLDKKAGNLIALANENGGRDNITVVLLQNNKKAQSLAPTRPGLSQQSPSKEKIEHSPASKPLEEIAVEKPASPKRNYGFTALIMLCLLLLASTVFLYLQTHPVSTPDQALSAAPTKIVRNSQESLLQDAINHALGDTLILSDSIFKSPVIISDTLRVSRDSLYIVANGIVLQADTGYKGAAITMRAEAKLLKIDSLQFKGFDTGIALSNQSLFLHQVSFSDCKLPVKNSFYFANQQLINAEFLKLNPLKKETSKDTQKNNGAK